MNISSKTAKRVGRNLLIAAVCLVGTKAFADVWIKNTTDTSSWPVGFPIPQPPGGVCIPVNGPYWDGYDTPFDSTMRTYAGPYVKVYLSPGTFYTRGIYSDGMSQTAAPGWRLQDHSELHGAGSTGANSTILLLQAVDSNYRAKVVANNMWSTASAMAVTDLQIDCNGPSLIGSNYTPPWNLQGAELWGTGSMTLQNLLVRHAAGYDLVGGESFILVLVATTAATNNLISNCTVQEFYNPRPDLKKGWCSAISLNRNPEAAGAIAGIVANCSVYLNGFANAVPSGEFAFNCLNGSYCIYTNNYCYGANRGFNNDSAAEPTIQFINNQMDIPGDTVDSAPGIFGMYLIYGIQWSRICGNIFNVYGANADAIMASGPCTIPPGSGVMNLLVDQNVVNKIGPWAGTSYGFDFADLNDGYHNYRVPSHISLLNNTVDSGLQNRVPASLGYDWGNTGNSLPNGFGWQYSPYRSDFNFDGNVDLVLQDSATDINVLELTRSFATTQVSTSPGSSGSPWQIAGVGDFDRNGTSDLLFQSTDSYGYLVYWYMGGTALSQWSFLNPTTAGGTWRAKAVADFNKDGKPDILFEDGNGYLGLWYMNGTNLSTSTLLTPNYVSDPHWQVVGTGDFDNDGNTDILFEYVQPGNGNNGLLALWYMTGSVLRSSVYLNPLWAGDPNWLVVSTADFSGDCNVDVMFQYRNTTNNTWGGNLLEWNLTNNVMQQANSITLPGAWNVIGPK
jgi:hypothetical protein